MVGAERTREGTRKRCPLKRWVTIRSRWASCRPILTPPRKEPRARTRRPSRTRRELPARRARRPRPPSLFAFFLVAEATGLLQILQTEVSQTGCAALRPGRAGETLLVRASGDGDVVEEVGELTQEKGLGPIAKRLFRPRMHVHEHEVRARDHALGRRVEHVEDSVRTRGAAPHR